MATKADFTEAEWETMHKGLTGAGLLVSTSDRDFTDSFGEAKALAKYLGEQHANSDSALMRDLAGTHGTGFGITTKPDVLEAETLEALRSAAATLAAKAPDEVGPYRELVLGLADHVAEAKSGVAPQETVAIKKITEALGDA